jgi:multicomponent Na+:H+ antiporter subunit C
MNVLTPVTIGLLLGLGVHQILQRDPLRLVVGFILWSNALNLFLLAMGSRTGQFAPYSGNPATSDPVPQALILTAIVISLGGLVFLLTLLRRLADRHGQGDLDRVQDLRR